MRDFRKVLSSGSIGRATASVKPLKSTGWMCARYMRCAWLFWTYFADAAIGRLGSAYQGEAVVNLRVCLAPSSCEKCDHRGRGDPCVSIERRLRCDGTQAVSRPETTQGRCVLGSLLLAG